MIALVWHNPAALWLLWALPIVWLIGVHAHRQVRRAADRLVGATMAKRLLPPLSWQAAASKTALLSLGLAMCIVAAARPAFGVFYRPVAARGLDLVVLLDVSRSMLADDGGDTRLGRARSAVRWLVDELDGDRVGLIGFAGQTVAACPLTLDRGFFGSALAAVGPQMVGRGGTQIGPALDAAMRMLDTSWDRDKLVLLVTDGGDQESFPKAAAERLRDKKVRVITLGLGSASEDAPLVIGGQIVRSADGQPVSARLNDTLLRDLAITSAGMYVPPESAHELPRLYRENFATARRGENQEMQEKLHREQYQWFLAIGLVLLLAQAGRATYRRPRLWRGVRGAASVVLLMALWLPLAACSRARSEVQAAIDLLARGEASEAESRFTKLVGSETAERAEPVLLYDLACAQQALGRVSEARRTFQKVLAKGDRRLRARTWVNLAVLDIAKVDDLAGQDVVNLPAARREEIESLANSALDALQRARELDAALGDAVAKQDSLARWLRATEDAWASADRAAAIAARDKAVGAAALEIRIRAETELLAGLAGGDLLEDLELEQRQLGKEFESIAAQFDHESGPLAEVFREEVRAALAAAPAECEAIADLLREGSTDRVPQAVIAAVDRWNAAWVLWADPVAALRAVASSAAESLQELQRLSMAIGDPGSDDAAAIEVLASARRGLAERADRVAKLADALARRVATDAHGVASTSFLARLRGRLPKVVDDLRRVGERVESQGSAAISLSAASATALAELTADAELSKLGLDALAQRLEREQQSLQRALDSVVVDRGAGADLTARLGARFAARLAWQGLISGQRAQSERAAYLSEALERRIAEAATAAAQSAAGPDPAGVPPAPDPAAAKAADAENALLRERIDAARAALESASAMVSGGDESTAAASMTEARLALRALALALDDFDGALARAARESDQLESLGAEDAAAAADADAGAILRWRESRREQAVTTPLVAMLSAALGAEIASLEKPIDSGGSTTPDAAGNDTAGTDAAGAEESREKLAALRAIQEPVANAAEAANAAIERLGSEVEDAAAAAAALRAAHPEQKRAAEALRAALEQLEGARLSVRELVQRILRAEEELIPLLGALVEAKARAADPSRPEAKITAEDGRELGWDDVAKAQAEIGSYVARLLPAFDREVAKAASQNGAEPVAESSESEQQLRKALETIGGLHAATQRSIEAEDHARVVADAEVVYDLARDLWAGLEELRPVLERAVDEQARALEDGRGFVVEPPAADALGAARRAQSRIERLLPPMEAKVESLAAAAAQAEQAAEAAAADPSSAPGGQAAPAAGSSVPPEVLDLAKRNLPLARNAMAGARSRLDQSVFTDAVDKQDEAHRLLREILDRWKEEEDKQQQQQQQQQPQQQESQPPEPQPSQGRMSPEELQRLMQAVRERNRQEPKSSARTPVKEDW